MAKNRKDLLAVKDGEEVLAKIVKEDDGYHVINNDGTMGPVCTKMTVDGYLILSANAANRKCINKELLDKVFNEGATEVPLTYRATRVIGAVGSKMPNEKLVMTYGTEEEIEEYKAIIEDAKARWEADKKKPLTEKEKLEAKIAKAQEQLAKLLAEAGE